MKIVKLMLKDFVSREARFGVRLYCAMDVQAPESMVVFHRVCPELAACA